MDVQVSDANSLLSLSDRVVGRTENVELNSWVSGKETYAILGAPRPLKKKTHICVKRSVDNPKKKECPYVTACVASRKEVYNHGDECANHDDCNNREHHETYTLFRLLPVSTRQYSDGKVTTAAVN